MTNEYLAFDPVKITSKSKLNETLFNITDAPKNSTKDESASDETFNNGVEAVMILVSLMTIGILLLGVFLDVQRLFLPWMVFYGVEIFCGYLVFLSFLTLSGRFLLASIVIFIRTVSLTYLWTVLVRRHLKEIVALSPRHLTLVDHIRYIFKKKIEPINEFD